MRHLNLRSKKKRLIVGSVLLAACAVGGTVTSANAQTWSATTTPGAWFYCVSNCQAGGVGAVVPGYGVSSHNDPGRQVGNWSRTVLIQCKNIVGNRPAASFRVTVKDKNWVGTWTIAKSSLSRSVDDSHIPSC